MELWERKKTPESRDPNGKKLTIVRHETKTACRKVLKIVCLPDLVVVDPARCGCGEKKVRTGPGQYLIESNRYGEDDGMLSLNCWWAWVGWWSWKKKTVDTCGKKVISKDAYPITESET